MRIAIIGIGNVGSALARGFSRAGHQILLGVRDTNNPDTAALARETPPRSRLRRMRLRAARWSCWPCPGKRRKAR
jgi:predicted dinucleotide-binding enzyme